MHAQTSALKPRDGLLTLSGYGIRISVERRHLIVEDGVGRDRRRGALHRATGGLKRLVVIGHTGYVTLDALRWLHDVGAAFVQLDGDGTVIAATSAVEATDVKLRRAQALAAQSDFGLALARELVRAKLRGQQAVLAVHGSTEVRVLRNGHRVGARAADLLDGALRRLDGANTRATLRYLEARAADAYWGALGTAPTRFARADLGRVPAHWQTLGSRSSPITGGPNKAATPANALLNYLYAILESETAIAARSVGLDPEMAFLHADQRWRNSLAHDLMEPIRPMVDRWVLEFLAQRTLAARDFVETREGVCRLAPDFARVLVGNAPSWGLLVRPIVEWAVRALQAAGSATPRAGKARSLSTPVPPRLPELPLPTATFPLPNCGVCGIALATSRVRFCPGCGRVAGGQVSPGPADASRLAERARRAALADPIQVELARTRRAAAYARRRAQADRGYRSKAQIAADRQAFVTELLPRLRAVGLPAMVTATGLSKPQCSMVKRGLRFPHPRHWPALRSISPSGA